MLKFFDLFSGIGGFRLGLERVGFQCVGSCEIDKYARQVYNNHWDEEIYPDARLLDISTLPDFDILTAGFPCQAFSIAGKRLGFNDTRGTIFFEIARITKEKRPKILFLENVGGLLNHEKGKTLLNINTLYEMGYDIEWQCINGKYFLPQRRERVFIIGHLREKPTSKIFPIGEATELAEVKNDGDKKPSINCIDANYWKGIDKHGQRTAILLTPNNFQHKAGDGIITRKKHMSMIHPALQANPGGSQKTYLVENLKIRMLTPLECERLQGFPDGWTEGISDTQRYKCLGNAVMVSMAEYISVKNQMPYSHKSLIQSLLFVIC